MSNMLTLPAEERSLERTESVRFFDTEQPSLAPSSSEIKLTRAPGLVGDLQEYFCNSARYLLEEGAILAALALVAGVAGRCFNIDGTGLNLYLLLLAESGRGKEEMDSGIERILASVRPNVPLVDEFIGPGTFASGQAVGRALEKSPSILSVQGEFGIRLKELNDPKAPMSTVVLRRVLLDLYAKSGRSKVLRPTVYSDREKNTSAVAAPCLTILGESTPGHVFNNLTFSDIEDGLLPRCLILECTSPRPRMNHAAGLPPPPNVVRSFSDLSAFAFMARSSQTFFNVEVDQPASEIFRELQEYLDYTFNDKTIDQHERALWNRAGLNVKRIAALVAIGSSVNLRAPVIQSSHAQWACDFVEGCVKQFASKFRAGAIGSGEERRVAEIKKYILDYLRMSPSKRRASYKVPARLAATEGCVGFDYLRRRASRCVAFTQSGEFNRVLNATLFSMCQSGALFKLRPEDVHANFGLRCEVYMLANVEALT